MRASSRSIDEYLANAPASHRAALERVRAIVRKAYPTAGEGFYYQLPAFRLNGKSLEAFRSSKTHCSLHPLVARRLTRGGCRYRNAIPL